MCTKYLHATVDKALKDLSCLEHVDRKSSEEVMRMSASTMDRCLNGLPRKGPGSIRKNRKSGANAPAQSFTCCSGESEIASSLPACYVQVDTVALCCRDMHGNFFWILTLTDKKTQRTEIWPVRFVKRHPEISFQRSRPLKKNDNAHVEQKNGSVVRGLFGEVHVDDMGMRGALERICKSWSAYFNFCKPCIMITKRAKMLSAKGFAKSYDAPRLPAQRALDEHIVAPAEEKFLKRKIASTNGIVLPI